MRVRTVKWKRDCPRKATIDWLNARGAKITPVYRNGSRRKKEQAVAWVVAWKDAHP